MVLDQMEQQVVDQQMPREQYERMEAFFNSPTGRLISVVQQMVIYPLIVLLTALLVWFGVGFVLGHQAEMKFALANAAHHILAGKVVQLHMHARRDVVKRVQRRR